ncbi:hypothetical protein EPA93_38955 [Ktedonosporobacter rubrisoli]|uniref:HAMP domain-containing protein n=1 Tax=Ktedonosporobacter rubrisoli TaxID=2509675 RepID=A0A4P6K1C0_KTERU|nr:hypothetical protein [Ktedonosporobacter rubrisoli]QBD81633.1 hypothetical protein EPA93_38955 [Ktedonosporobacter rubrisoli]
MKKFSSHTDFESASTSDSESPIYLAPKTYQESRALRWWYRLSSPPEPERSASFEKQERFRRGRIGSQIILGLYLLLFVSLPTGFIGTNTYLALIVILSTLGLIVATLLNRMGLINQAGILAVLTSLAFPVLNIITTPGGLSMEVLPLFGLLVLPLVCAVSFLPPWWVFLVAIGNCFFTWLSLTYLPHTAELDAILTIAFVGIITPIILIQLLVSVVAFAWVHGTIQALVRADTAEEIARLEHDLGQQAKVAAQQKQLLEASIQKIVATHMRVANGDFGARAPLNEENVLWQISGPLNNLLARTQNLRQESVQLQAALQQAYWEIERLRARLSLKGDH